jgi:predicted PurR-regulated permease PerM
MKSEIGDSVTKFFISIMGISVILVALKEFQFIFIPFTIAYFLYFVFEPVNKYIVQFKIPKALTVIIDLAILILILYAISHIFIASFERMGTEFPQYGEKINYLVRSAAVSLGVTDPAIINFNLNTWLSKIDYSLIAGGVFSSTVSFFSTAFLVLFFFIFISSGHSQILEAVKDRYVEKNIILSSVEENNAAPDSILDINKIKSDRGEKIEQTFKDITGQVQNYIATKFLINLASGVIFTIVLLLFGVDYAIIWGAFSFLFNFIPNIGSIFSVIFPSLMSLIQFGSFGYTGAILLTLIVIQNLIGNIIEPKIFGNRLGLNPIVILISLLLWGYLWGIVGMFVSVPLTAIIKISISGSSSKNLRFLSRLMSS